MILAHEYINLSQYSIVKLIEIGNYSNTYQIKENKSGKLHIANMSRYQIQDDSVEYNQFIKSEIIKMSSMDHPSILKFEGFNIKDFKQKNRLTIITESSSSMVSLSKFLSNLPCKWDNTQKLICIYGIASSMAFLHKKNIVHSDLNSKTIFIDEFFHPKIMYTKIQKVIGKTSQVSREIDDSSLFFTSEIVENSFYSKEDDVFDFSSILYHILYGHKKYPKKQNEPSQDNDDVVGDAFQRLFEKCNSGDPKERPTFSEITKKLRRKKEFSKNVNSEIFFQYVNSIEGDNVSSVSESDIKSESSTENNVEHGNQNENIIEHENLNQNTNNEEHENLNQNTNNEEHENLNQNTNNEEHENLNQNTNNEEHENLNQNANNEEHENLNQNTNNEEHENQNSNENIVEREISNENNLVCPVCQNKIDNKNDIYYCRDHPYHINCIECRICHKNLLLSNNDHFICVAPGLFICQNDFEKYKNQKNDLPKEIQEEYLNKIVKYGIDSLFDSFFDYHNIDDDLINAILNKGDDCINILPINKYFKLFIPYVTFHFENSPSQINFDELINRIPEEFIIINIEKGSTFLTIALIASDALPKTEKEYYDMIEPLKKFFNSAIGKSIVGNFTDETIINFPNDESIKEFFARESINLLQLKDILNKIDFNRVKNEVELRFKKKAKNKNWKFILKNISLYNEAEKSVRKDIKNNEIELILTGITIIANQLYKEFREINANLSKEKNITNLFLYHGTKLNNHALIATSRFLHPDENDEDLLTDVGYFGRGIYATDNIFYSLMYSQENNNQYLQYNEKASVMCCITFYDNEYCVFLNDLKNKFYKTNIFKGKNMNSKLKQNYGIHKVFVESIHKFEPYGINNNYFDRKKASKRSYITAFEYVFPNTEQIIPVMSLTFMRPKYYVLWLNENENEKVLNELRYKSEVNIYSKRTIDKACLFVDKKIRNMLKLIISVENCDLCRDFIDKIRKFHDSNFICLIYSTNKDLIKLSQEMVNVLFTYDIEDLYRFVKINLEKEEIEAYYKELENKYNISFSINDNDLVKFRYFDENL